ncbi:hypothetical protein BUALT_Bualt17G0096000 [Buddleja alternifolia]|uniref:Transmembrane protein n=1 Tax=Buddleja alternifolia TaxID=168488 RepID=A0AAV6WI49_9LAMI|nr:hypothetical protein BUALT_Bualt17G0096000 [Buddleja alternifolia]
MQCSVVTLCSSRSPPLLNFTSFKPLKIFNSRTPVLLPERSLNDAAFNADDQKKRRNVSLSATTSRGLYTRRKLISTMTAAKSRGGGDGGGSVSDLDDNVRNIVQAFLWIAEGVYIVWLFLLPYAPGDPVWAISSETINSLIGLSLNFFFILPLSNSVVGFHLVEAPVLHPMSEGLFNFVIGWTLMFAPLLYTDKRRDRYKGSIDVLWGFQMFLTNTFLIPYMAIRLNEADDEYTPKKTSELGSVMTNGAPVVGLIGGIACLLSILWALYGRGDGNYGNLQERWEFLQSYLGSERLAYAFIWDICLYIVFQPWLIGDNLQNIRKGKVLIVNFLRFVPVVGLIAYCLCLNSDDEI